MSRQVSLVESVREVGQQVYEAIDEETDIPPNLQEWMASFGLDRAEDPTRSICDLAAFNRLLKLTLYRVYRQESADLSRLSADNDVYAAMADARVETGDTAFAETVLDEFVKHVDSDLFKPLFKASQVLMNKKQPADEVGRIFETILDGKIRRKRGQFRTPTFVASFMAHWAIRAGDDTVLDPGVGAGVLTSCMYDRKQAVTGETSVTDMYGVDISELAITMASTAIKLENGEGSPNFIATDYMNTSIEDSTARLDQQNPTALPKMDAIVSNPPYSRSHALDGDRQKYNNIVDTESNFSTTEHTPLYAYFLAHSEQFLKKGGRLAFITGSRFLDTTYGEHLQEFILDRFTIEALIFPDLDDPLFGDLDVNPCITLLEKSQPEESHETALVRVDKWPDTDRLVEAVTGGEKGEVSFGFVNRVEQTTLEPGVDWRQYIDPSEIDSITGLKKFNRIATIRRGIATGKNDYFCLTSKEVEDRGLSTSYLSRLIRRTSGFDGLAITQEHWEEWKNSGDQVWLLYCYEENDKNDPEPIKMEQIKDNKLDEYDELERYLDHGREIGADETYLANNRKHWHVVDQRSEPEILVTYMSKDGFRFIRNDAGIRTLNNLHNVHFLEDDADLDRDQIDALLAYLNSGIADEITKRSSRTYARGLHKIEPGELKDVPVIDPRNLEKGDVESLSETFNHLCDAIDGDEEDIQKARERLDATVREVLGLPN